MTMSDELRLASAPRWRGQPGRIEVWYATLTDPLTGAALWVHYETVAPAPDTQAASKAGDSTSAEPATPAAVAPEPAAKPSVTVEKLKGFLISPALWIVAGLAFLIILILAMMGGRKPKRRTAPRVGGEAHA